MNAYSTIRDLLKELVHRRDTVYPLPGDEHIIWLYQQEISCIAEIEQEISRG